jgi:predicted transposase YdaD
MTIAERLKTQARQEGLEKGLHQGLEQEKCSTAKRMLEKGFSDDEIISCTLVSTQLLHELKKMLEKDK